MSRCLASCVWAGTNRQPSHGPRTSASLLPSGSGREKRAGSIPSSGRCFVPLMPPWGEWGHLIVNAPFTPRSRFLSEAGVEGQPGRPQVASMFALLPLPLLTPDPLDSRWVVSQRMLQTPCRTPSLPISCSRACSASSPPLLSRPACLLNNSSLLCFPYVTVDRTVLPMDDQ